MMQNLSTSIPGIPNEYGSLIANQLKHDYVQKAVVFGSRAKGNYKASSDIDIALYGAISFEQLAEINYAIKNLGLPWGVDVVAIELVSEAALKEHIEHVGINI
jgi:predicted nucleotidyltransferase